MKKENKVILQITYILVSIFVIYFLFLAIRDEVNPKDKIKTFTGIKTELKEKIIKKKEKYHEVDFREAILFYGMKLSLNDVKMNENQSLWLASEATWVVGIHYNNKWNKAVILRNGEYNKIEGTPFSVRLNGSVGLLIPESEMERIKK